MGICHAVPAATCGSGSDQGVACQLCIMRHLPLCLPWQVETRTHEGSISLYISLKHAWCSENVAPAPIWLCSTEGRAGLAAVVAAGTACGVCTGVSTTSPCGWCNQHWFETGSTAVVITVTVAWFSMVPIVTVTLGGSRCSYGMPSGGLVVCRPL
jgi:hypothetical protein